MEIARLNIGSQTYELTDVQFSETEPETVEQTWEPRPSHWSVELEFTMTPDESQKLFDLLSPKFSNDIDLTKFVRFAEDRGVRVTSAWVDRWAGELRFATEVNGAGL